MCNQKSLETSTNKHHLETENAIIENIAELTSNANSDDISDENLNPFITLRNVRLKNLDNIIIGHLNINSVRHKIIVLKSMTEDNIDILVISETKLDNSFPTHQFNIDGYDPPHRLDRDKDGGGLLVYFRTGIPSRNLKTKLPENIGRFL